MFQRGGLAHNSERLSTLLASDMPVTNSAVRPVLHPWERQRGVGVTHDGLQEEPIMDREHIKGAADKVKGAVKDTAGKVTGDKKMQAEGKMDKAKGAAHDAVGDAKDTARDATR